MGNLLDLVNDVAIGHLERNFWEGFYNTYHLMMRPIGLLSKSYDFLYDNLTRNIGNVQFTYDGYGTPIGGISDPFYNTISVTPWFISDTDKNSYPNYIEYVKAVYGATLSIENINSNAKDAIKNIEDMRVASIKTDIIVEGNGNLNPNGIFNDTKLGKLSSSYSKKALDTAIAYNGSKRKLQSITSTLNDYYGLKEKPIQNGILTNTDVHGLLTDKLDGPLDDNGYSFLNTYNDFIKSLGEANKEQYEYSIKERNKFRTSKGYNSWDYLASDFITKSVDNKRYNISIGDDDAFDFGGTLGIYNEDTEVSNYANANNGARFSKYTKFSDELDSSSLLSKTNKAFKNGEYKALIGKFNTGKIIGGEDDILQTAISKNYGMSHGRNLLKEDAVNESGEASYSSAYDNPYCRVWTYHHQYKSLSDAIRPLKENGSIVSQSELASKHGFDKFEADNSFKDGFENGRTRLGEFGVMNKNNGLVNITPIDDGDENKRVSIKNCMFSIENLAWKDTLTTRSSYNIETLSEEQKGPFGGRIMWFPPYDLKFNESVNVNWAETNFIGRGESIYTYKNTKRSGTLSFKLLIDHPSIINYWTNAKDSGNNTVDDVKSSEQELLRFFAGCSFLTPSVPSSKEEDIATVDDPVDSPNTETFTFYVFFPNNYSGVDDDYNYAMDYLINGYGTWKSQFNDVIDDYKKTSEIVIAKNVSHEDKIVGGYEVRPGISLDYPIKGESEITDGIISAIKYGKTEISYISPMQGNGQNFKYYYRVDKKYLKNPLKQGGSNYFDILSQSACLNSSAGTGMVVEQFKTEDEYTFSFADMYIALKEGNSQDVLSGLYDASKLSIINNKVLRRKDKIVSVICTGSASAPGKDNETLAKNRAKTVKKWLVNNGLCSDDKAFAIHTESTGGGNDINTLESRLNRNVRVEIMIASEETATAQNNEMDAFSFIGSQKKSVHGIGIPLDNRTKLIDYNANINYDSSAVFKPNNINLNKFGDLNNGLGLNIRGKDVIGLKTQYNLPGVNDFLSDTKKWAVSNDYMDAMTPNDKQTYMHTNEKYDTSKEEMESRGGYNTNSDGGDTLGTGIGRYDGEAKFFQLLELKDPFLHHKISEKVKYFDPAFHSVSPEGFNARLTFLQQCCRQGPTVSSSDSATANAANNLAFGRPPVCILRIGDFFYTRIIIEDIQIDYDNNGIQWDLNPEGIGVMPMIANVNIRFNFIGGSSLAGPISRLQNALSFNMYANTEVYDNRAELAEYDPNTGDITRLAPFNPAV